jgi:hypothetical protein
MRENTIDLHIRQDICMISEKTISALVKSDKEIELENWLSPLADRTRLCGLSLLADGEVCVGFFVEVLQIIAVFV